MSISEQNRHSKALKLIKLITGRECNTTFGTQLSKAFSNAFPGTCNDATESAGIECMLYLSHFKAGFPLQALRTFHTNIKEDISPFSFNCKQYEKIYSLIPHEALNNAILLDKDAEEKIFTLTKQDILEALDFFTNQ